MSAASALQSALVGALKGHAPLMNIASGVFDGPPARAAFPYVAIGEGVSGDWSSKTTKGREHRLAIIVWDDGQSAARLHGVMAEAEAAIEAMPGELDGHRVASLSFVRSRVRRDPAGPWAGVVEYRVRTVAND
jgi:hypothetical protein